MFAFIFYNLSVNYNFVVLGKKILVMLFSNTFNMRSSHIIGDYELYYATRNIVV